MSTLALRRPGAALVAGAVVAAGFAVAGPTTPASAAGTSQADAAAGWAIGRLAASDLLEYENYGMVSTDVGLSIDLALGLQEISGYEADVDRIATAVEGRAPSYAKHDTAPVTWDCATFATIPETSYDSYYSNATAKAVVGLKATGRTGSTLDGLVDQVETVTIDGGADAGRISDHTVQGGVARPECDYANVFGQALAVRALDAVGSPEEDAAVGYLLSQQNADGSWNEGLRPVGGAQPAADPSADGTATALIHLQAIAPSASRAAAVQSAVDKGVAWLVKAQAADGSFGAGGFGPNANETGLGAWALGSTAGGGPAVKAAGWLLEHQVGSGTFGDPGALADEAGAVAYDDQAVSDGRTDGITAALEGQWIRSTVQAIPALASSSVSGVAATSPFGRTPVVNVTVAAPGAQPTGTVRVLRGATELAAGTLTAGSAALVVPARVLAPGAHELTVSYAGTGDANASRSIVRLTVVKAASKVRGKLRTKRLEARRTRGRLAISARAFGVVPTGKVVVRLPGGKTVKGKLRNGKVVVKLPVFRTPGLQKLKVSYRGDRYVRKASTRIKVNVVR